MLQQQPPPQHPSAAVVLPLPTSRPLPWGPDLPAGPEHRLCLEAVSCVQGVKLWEGKGHCGWDAGSVQAQALGRQQC